MDPRNAIPSAHALTAVVVTGALLAFTALIGPVAFEAERKGLEDERGYAVTPAAASEVRAAQAARLSSYAWIDRDGGVVALPIERAMELITAELGRDTHRREDGR